MRLGGRSVMRIGTGLAGIQRDARAVDAGKSGRAVRGEQAAGVAPRPVAAEVAAGDSRCFRASTVAIAMRFGSGASESAEGRRAEDRCAGQHALGAVRAVALSLACTDP